MIGETLAHFKITAKLGEGGMGEVYRAEDTKLGREVAIKVLPESVADDPERLARFEREARVLAALEHANIAGIYGLEEADGRQLLVMQLVEGETVQEHIARGPIPVPQAMEMALQITQALEAAHDKGIVHRDLKPANIKITPGGQVKVLDFGLAKALEVENSQSRPELTQSPTLTAQMTGTGVLLGTAAYMSPEQARGDAADRRADIWAFGVVLFEMLTGKMTYAGKTVSDTLAGVLRADPEWDELSSETPRSVRRLLERCLEKEKDDRLQAIGEARIVIQRYLADPDAAEEALSVEGETPRGEGRFLPWGVAALAVLALVFALWLLWPKPATPGPIIKAAIPPPENSTFHLHSFTPGPAVVSPDGTKIVFSARNEDGLIQLYVRPLDSSQAYALTGTLRAQYPFWSPDSRWIGFFTMADATLKKIDASGGPPISLCSAVDVKGASWSTEGVIIFAPDAAVPLNKVSAAGGEATQITELDTQKYNSHRQPRFLPDGRHFLFLARASGGGDDSVMLGSLESEPRELLLSPSQAEYSQGRLLFVRDQTLMAQPFDLDRLELTGEAVPLVEKVLVMKGAALSAFSASNTGILTYVTGDTTVGAALEWRDHSGELQGTLGDGMSHRQAVVSPDGTLAAVTIEDSGSATYDIWIYEIDRNLRTRFTFDNANDDYPVWSPDSSSLYFVSNRKGKFDIYRKAIGGVGEVEEIFASDMDKTVTGVSPDGQSLIFSQTDPSTKADIWLLPLEGKREPQILRQTAFDEDTGHLSPDGRWLAYDSDESGPWQVYVTPFPGPGRRWQISTESGNYNAWAPDGKSLYLHRDDGQIEVVSLELGQDSLRVGPSETLFRTTPPGDGGPWLSVAPDSERFLIVPTTEQQANTLLNLVINWPALLDSQ